MHEVDDDVDDFGRREILWAVVIVVAVSFCIFKYYSKAAAVRRAEILKLQKLAADDIARAEREEAEEFSSMLFWTRDSVAQNYSSSSLVVDYPPSASEETAESQNSVELQNPPISSPITPQASFLECSRPLVLDPGLCVVCGTPTKKQCSRCKAVKYCSRDCQVAHWTDGHKQVCQQSEKQSASTTTKLDGVACSKSSEIPVIKEDSLSKNATSGEARGVERLPAATSKSLRTLDSITFDRSLPNPSRILFPYEQFIELFRWNSLKLVPCGLENCGNSCFANVVLQCLTFTRPIAVYLLKGRHSEECRRNDWCFMCELQHHVLRVLESQVPFSPLRIVSQIRNIGNHMGYGRQEDAHEFMRFAIDSMQSICLDKEGGEKAVDQRTQETTFIQHIFGGHLQSQVRCMQCQQDSFKYENMMDLAVEIQGNVESLEDALAQFTNHEWLDGENKYKCDRCNDYVKAWKCLSVHEAPNILMIALKRFQSGKFGKLNKRVTFPDILDISSYMSASGDRPPVYQLYGVIVHIDMLNASFFGHYICYIKDFLGFWYKIDDSKVKGVDIDKVMQQRAYMLLYTRSAPRQVPYAGKRGGQASGKSTANLYDSTKPPSSNGNHYLSEPSILSGDAANGNGVDIYSDNCEDLVSEISNFLTQ